MEEEILSLILKYTDAGKLADENFIYEVCSIIINEFDLDEYVRDIKIIYAGNKDSLLATYVYFKRIFKLYIFIDEFNKYFTNNKLIQKLPNEGQRLFYKNLFFVEVIRHEIEHAHQEYLKDYEESLESDILLATNNPYDKMISDNCKMHNFIVNDIQSERDLIRKSHKFTKKVLKYYEYSPNERLAHIRSKLFSLELAKMNQDYSRIAEINNKRLNYVIYHAYQNLDSPTIYFSKKMHLMPYIEQYSWYHKNIRKCLEKSSQLYPFSERLLLGLPISTEERGIIYDEYINNETSSLIRKNN